MPKRAFIVLSAAVALSVAGYALPASGAGAASAASTAAADAPFAPRTQITDLVGALTADQKASVQQALDNLYRDNKLKLFVAYVKDFSADSPTAWVDKSATLGGMGRRDLLLGIATSGRQYAVSTDPDVGLTTAQLDNVAANAIEPALRAFDWSAAAIGAASGYAAALGGRPIPVPTITQGTLPGTGQGTAAQGMSSGTIVAIVVVVLIGGLLLFLLVRRRGRDRAAPEPGGLTLQQLEAKAGHLLVTTDDAVRTSEQELGFATAQFGDEAAAPFALAMERAKGELTAAFKLRQLLDDDIPEDDATKRRMLEELCQRCENANEILDEQAAAFDKLRDLEKHAPQMVERIAANAEQQPARLATARNTLAELSAKYAPSAITEVAGNADEAATRLDFMSGAITQAREAVSTGDMSRAAVLVQAAQSAQDQAGQLLDGVGRRASELREASGALAGALAGADASIAEAAAADSVEVRGVAAQTQTVVAQVRAEANVGPSDPLDALRRVEEATARLDQALGGVRAERERQQRARASLEQAVLTARSSIAAASDFITTNRGAIGSTARTRVAEAQRRLDHAISLAASDPESALRYVQQADDLAAQAYQEARGDVQGYAGAGRMFGGQPGDGAGMAGMAGAVLGGILINGILGGGGSGGGRPAPRAPAAGSWGGASTRGRHSVGGRF